MDLLERKDPAIYVAGDLGFWGSWGNLSFATEGVDFNYIIIN